MSKREMIKVGVLLVLAYVFYAILVTTVSTESQNRFVRWGYSDLQDGISSVHVIRDTQNGQCRAYVQVKTKRKTDTYSRLQDESISINDTWPVECGSMGGGVIPPTIPPVSSPIKTPE